MLGVGNVLCGDEGIGCRVVEYLYASYQFCPQVELLDGGTMGQELLDWVMNADRLLLFDCVDFGLRPGSIAFRDGSDMPIWLGTRKMSPHQGSFAEIMALASLKNASPKEIILIGVQPETVEFGQPLSPLIRSKIPAIAKKGLLELSRWGIEALPRKEKIFLNQTDLALQHYEKDFAF